MGTLVVEDSILVVVEQSRTARERHTQRGGCCSSLRQRQEQENPEADDMGQHLDALPQGMKADCLPVEYRFCGQSS